MPLPTLLDIVNSIGSEGLSGLIEETIVSVPEVQLGAARTIAGTNYKTTVRVGLPTGSGFRKANAGVAPGKSRRELRNFECQIVDRPWLCDKAVADKHPDGAADYISDEGVAIVQAQLIELGRQFYYGEENAEDGHPGLEQMYDDENMTVDAGGSTADTGSSIWALKWGVQGVQWLYGGEGADPLQLSAVKEIVLNMGTAEAPELLTHYHQQLLAWVGLKLGNLKFCAKIKNLTEQVGKGCTDSRLGKLVGKFPIGYKPDVIFMTPRSMEQWIDSKTATTTTGAEVPKPTNFRGIPVVETDSILNTEAIS